MAGAAQGGAQIRGIQDTVAGRPNQLSTNQFYDQRPMTNDMRAQEREIANNRFAQERAQLTIARPEFGGSGGQPQNYATQSLGDVNQAALQARSAMGYSPQQIQMGTPFSPERISAQQIGSRDVNAERVAAERVAAGQLAGTSLDPYMNPFTSQVVNTTLGDLERQRQIQQQGTAAQAARAGAFGGSRQGVAESLTNEAFARQAAQTAAGLRQAGFSQAQQQAQQDIQRRLEAARLNQATGLQASLANQQTGLQAQTANQRAALEAARANQQSALQASQLNQATGLQAGLAGQQLGVDVQRLNQAAGLQGAQFRLGAGQQLAGLGQDRFGMGQTIESQIQQQELAQQMLQQQLADRARQQFMGYTQAPAQGLGYLSGALGATPGLQTQTQTMQPGVFDYLSLGAYGAANIPGFSDERLKTDVEEIKIMDNGIKVVRWKWNETGKKIADPNQPTVGVIAQQIAKIIPEAVKRHASGYLMVDYSHPELRGV